jgi:hypothetical protein
VHRQITENINKNRLHKKSHNHISYIYKPSYSLECHRIVTRGMNPYFLVTKPVI